MKKLFILRHAKSSWDDPDIDDHERPLAPRGARAGTLIGRHLKNIGINPDLILCSTAKRARDTLHLVLAQLDSNTDPLYERSLYMCGAQGWIQRLRGVPETFNTVLVVGHNPDLHELAAAMAVTGDEDAIDSVMTKMPTAGLAEFDLDMDAWSAFPPLAPQLVRFITPRDLA
ncbi:MAG: histidine phosphatase family protein [Pseudomonadota bacterium]|nr:histidine phosphatase family protein [Pseudomonadota bacterium]